MLRGDVRPGIYLKAGPGRPTPYTSATGPAAGGPESTVAAGLLDVVLSLLHRRRRGPPGCARTLGAARAPDRR